MGSMKEQYGKKRGEQVFYASKNKGVIKGVEKRKEALKRTNYVVQCFKVRLKCCNAHL